MAGTANGVGPRAVGAGATTPAGGQVNSSWERLSGAIDAFAAFLAGAREPGGTRAGRDYHVLFRCGTVARAADGDPEFQGYESGAYAFPDPGPNAVAGAAETIASVMADNRRVWEAQRNLPVPAAVQQAVRRGFARALGQAFPYPGTPAAARRPIRTGVALGGNVSELWMVFWPELDPSGGVFSLAVAPAEGDARAAARLAFDTAGRLRQYDYMFPEVAAVFTPGGRVWAYGPTGAFVCRNPE